uniref:Inner centromere protein ARK-binding domain-containing protein n=1 Tax=Anopheles melas TaxID=34690 RepID=A0A182U5L1_9DIPT
MDELLEMFNSFIGEALDYERAMDAEFVELEKKLSECVSLAKERGTPVQNKKRPKRQASLSEKEEEASGKSAGEEEEKSEARTSTNDRSTTGGTGKSSSARMLDVSGGKGAGEKEAPQPMDTTTSQANETSVRPSRTARLKAQEKLKEPAIGSKLRNDGGTAVTIKLERNSSVANSTLVRGGKEALVAMEKTTLERTYVEMETENDANRANRIISPAAAAAEKRTNDEGFSSANEASQKEPAKQAGKSERDMSLLVVPAVIPKVEIVSDEEMPPPSIMPPPKLPAPKVRTKKKPPVGEKGAKDSSDTASSSAVSSADSTMNSTASSVSSSASNSSSTTAKNRVGRPTRTKNKQTGKQVEEPVATEAATAPSNPTTPPAVLMDVGVLIEPMRIKAEKLSIVQQQPAPADRTSDKSTYEDAQEQQEPMEVETTTTTNTTTTAQLQSQMRPLKIALKKIPSHELPQQAHVGPSDMNGTYTTGTAAAQPIPSDGTFTMPPSIHDGTFTVNSPMENARGAPICNETFNIPAAGDTPPMAGSERHPDDTYVIEKSGGSSGSAGQQQQHVPLANASIMTEDDSVVENSPVQLAPEQLKSKTTTPRTRAAAAAPPPVPGPKPQRGAAALKKSASAVADAKKHKELFNPCVMSPIKSRIEAFEKCATATGGSAASKIGTPQAQIGRLMKTVSTPTLGTTEPHGITRSAHAKPYTSSSSSSSVYTPNCAAQPPMPKASSASKIGQMQSRALHHGTTTGKSSGGAQSHSRDSSWDRAGGGGGSGGTLSAASSTSSLLDEKKKKREEKQRLAAAQREAMEREKREHAERLVREKEEKYRKLVQEKQEKLRLDAQKKARKLEEFEKRRQAEEQKALADQKRDELAKQLADQERKKLFTFEMIDTDDSTDEEVSEDTSAPRKKQRPPLPEWCQKTADFRKQLQLQAQLQSSVIDRLFSVQPMTPDLRLLFPSIDAQKLKRNSSAIWRTPPRHSQLP